MPDSRITLVAHQVELVFSGPSHALATVLILAIAAVIFLMGVWVGSLLRGARMTRNGRNVPSLQGLATGPGDGDRGRQGSAQEMSSRTFRLPGDEP